MNSIDKLWEEYRENPAPDRSFADFLSDVEEKSLDSDLAEEISEKLNLKTKIKDMLR